MSEELVFPVAVDFDGVIHSYTSAWAGHDIIPDAPVDGAIEWLNIVAAHYPVVIFTTRASTAAGRTAVLEWLSKHGFIGELHDVTALKPPAILILDDRAWRFQGPGTFPSIQQIADAKPWWER